MLHYDVTGRIATIAIDTPGSQNVMGPAAVDALFEAVERAQGDRGVDGIVLTSAKADFVAGADVSFLYEQTDPAAVFEWVMQIHKHMRALERGKPVVTAMPGTALGLGLELALATHYRVAAENPKARFGLPEVTIGVLPGAGGTQRLPRLIGIAAALQPMLEGKRLRPEQAHGLGILDAVVAPDALLPAAREWLQARIADGKPVTQPWDAKGFRIPGGAVQSPGVAQIFMAGNAMLREKTYGNYPAATNAMSCVYEGLQTDIDTGLLIEARYFAKTATGPEAKNMMRLLFFGIREANKLERRPPDVPTQAFSRVGVLGAGMMGSGIAAATANAGIDVVLIDASQEAADRGKAYAKEAVRERIEATTDFGNLANCELVIETVFEDRAIKADVTKRAEAAISSETLLASNTSTLPITGLAEAATRPHNFIGLHFFSPADRMPLVEIIVGERTGAETVARAMDYVRAINKTPIVVKDSRGFYTSRVFATYLTEGLAMLAQGVAPALIDNAGRMAGMPVGPLALADEVSLELVYKINKQTRADLGDTFVQPDAERVAIAMVEKLGRLGKKTGRGFYEYTENGRRLWPGLREHFAPAKLQPDVHEVIDRLIVVQSIEAARCLEEGIVQRPIDADVGALLGWGYPAFRGGPLGWIDTVGVPAFVERSRALARNYGERFVPPQILIDMAAADETFYPAPGRDVVLAGKR